MKELKDYLHLYLGAKVRYNYYDYNEDTWTIWETLTPHLLDKITTDCSIKSIKIQLRRLSDMTEEEGKEMINSIYHSIYNHETEIKKLSRFENDDSVGFVAYAADDDRLSVTIEIDRGIEFYVRGNEMVVKQFDITKSLLSKHFDLFGLIEAGLAIDKTQIPA